MLAFIVRRLFWMLLVMFVISVLVFLIFFATPGVDPARQMAGRNPDPATIAAIKHEFGLDRPLPIRYGLLMKHLFVDRDLISYAYHTKVIPEIVSALLACFAALLFGLLAGFYGGIVDAFLSRLMDLIWAFPLYLLAISLATVLLTQGLKIWVVNVTPGSLWIPILIIGVVYIPYVFRPVRGQVLSVREKEYIEAGVAAGASNARLMFSEILPNVASTIIVLLPLMIATTVLTEAALSYLSIGVQPPKASWGNIISDGQDLLYTRPMVAIAPGVMIVLTVLALNILGDGLRDALDPRAKVRA